MKHTPDLFPNDDGMIYIGPFQTCEDARKAIACAAAIGDLDVAKVAALLDAVMVVASSEVGCDQYGQGLLLESEAMTDLEDSIRAAKGGTCNP